MAGRSSCGRRWADVFNSRRFAERLALGSEMMMVMTTGWTKFLVTDIVTAIAEAAVIIYWVIKFFFTLVIHHHLKSIYLTAATERSNKAPPRQIPTTAGVLTVCQKNGIRKSEKNTLDFYFYMLSTRKSNKAAKDWFPEWWTKRRKKDGSGNNGSWLARGPPGKSRREISLRDCYMLPRKMSCQIGRTKRKRYPQDQTMANADIFKVGCTVYP